MDFQSLPDHGNIDDFSDSDSQFLEDLERNTNFSFEMESPTTTVKKRNLDELTEQDCLNSGTSIMKKTKQDNNRDLFS